VLLISFVPSALSPQLNRAHFFPFFVTPADCLAPPTHVPCALTFSLEAKSPTPLSPALTISFRLHADDFKIILFILLLADSRAEYRAA